MTGRSVAMGWAFPRRAEEQYNRYLTFRDASADEVSEWKAALAGACAEAVVQVRETARSQVSGAYLPNQAASGSISECEICAYPPRSVSRFSVDHPPDGDDLTLDHAATAWMTTISRVERSSSTRTFTTRFLRGARSDSRRTTSMNLASRISRLIPIGEMRGIYERLSSWRFWARRAVLEAIYPGSLEGIHRRTRFPSFRWKFASELLGNGDRALMRGVIAI